MNRIVQWGSFLFILIALAVGFVMGSLTNFRATADKAPYKDLENFAKVLQYVEANYVQEVKSRSLIDNSLRGMIDGLDPHSAYLLPEVYREMREETTGKFGGVGIEVSLKGGMITVVAPIDDTPAARAGVLSGDMIVKINGKATKDMSLPEAVAMMRGNIGSKIDIAVARKGADKPIEFSLKREQIRVQSVKSFLLDGDMIYLRISSFQERTTQDLKLAYEKMKKKVGDVTGVILDLRGNPGGLLDEAVGVVNLFIDEGPVVHTIGRDKSKKSTEFAQKGRKIIDVPTVVLVDGGSASASEIVAGALKDYGRAIVAGNTTFGKGSVQTIIPVADDAGLKLTIARYYTPSGNSIQAKGITPDVEILDIDQKVVDDAKKKNKRLREADLERHFENEQGDVAANKDREAQSKEEKEATLSIEERIKKDYMVKQAEGILHTMKIVGSGLKKPEFRLDEADDKKAEAKENTL